MWHVVTNRFMTNTYGVPRLCFPQLNKSSTCFFDRKCDFLFILFRTDRDTIEETGDVVVSPWKILTLNLIVVQYSI